MKVLLNGKDLYKEFNIEVTEYQGIFNFPKYKTEVSQSWPDQHGLEILDIKDNQLFEPRNITLGLVCVASSTQNLYNNIENFRNELRKSGLHELYFADIDIGFAVYRIEKKDVILKKGTIARFQMILINPYPTNHFVITGLQDDNGVALEDDNNTVITGNHQKDELQ